MIATRHRAIPELVEHERNRLLVPVGDALALASSIVRFAADSSLAVRFGAAAFELAAIWAERFLALCPEVARP